MNTAASAEEDFLFRSGLARAGESPRWHRLAGGVSSDIWRVELPGRDLCIKRALPTLKVADEWHAPVDRNDYEWGWLNFAHRHCPGTVPRPLAHDSSAGLFAMAYLDPGTHPVWKQRLLQGSVDLEAARQVGGTLARLHNASAGRADVAKDFETDGNFHALRLEPYLLATARRHPGLAGRLRELADRTAGCRSALVHGDVSPKNILLGPQGPVFLDAECAWYGDPAFDLAFCLNHFLLKALLLPEHARALSACFAAFADAYLGDTRAEPPAAIERRAAELLPALLLARVDGKSPVEYLADHDRARVRIREVSGNLLVRAPADPRAVARALLDGWPQAAS